MTLSFLRTGPALVVQLVGTLGAGSDLAGLRASVGRPRGPGVRAVFVDLALVTRLDALGIGALLQLRRQVQSCGLAFGLIQVQARPHRLLQMAGVTVVLKVHEDMDAALASLSCVKPEVTARQTTPRGLSRFYPGRGSLGNWGGTGMTM